MNSATRTKLAFNYRVLICLLIALIYWGRLFIENRVLRTEVSQLEAELGLMKIEDLNRAYFVEIEKPEVPSEVAKQLDQIWQFRCYLPPFYDLHEFRGIGSVTKEGVYCSGIDAGYRSRSEYHPVNVLVTIAISKKEDYWEVYYSYGGEIQISKWRPARTDLSVDELVVQKLVSSKLGTRSFDADTILPLLKLYDPKTTVDRVIDGNKHSTYDGVIYSIYPKRRASDFRQMVNGVMPQTFDPKKLAAGISDE